MNAGRAAAIVLVSVLPLAACDQRGTTGTDFERMKRQPRYDTYGEGPFFRDGRAMRPAPAGTVPFQTREPGSAQRAATPSDTRVPITMALLQQGRLHYETVCEPCHGVDGRAETAVARSMQLRPPPSLVEGRIAALPPAVVYDVITRGFGLMPSYAPQLADDDRWAVAAYVQALRVSNRIALGRLDPEVRARGVRALASSGAGGRSDDTSPDHGNGRAQ